MVVPGRGAAAVAGDVYRDGDAVVVVVDGNVAAQTPFGAGAVQVEGRFMIRFRDEVVFDWAKSRGFDKNPALYSKLVGVLKIDDDARNAPELPDEIRRAFANGEPLPPREQPDLSTVVVALPPRKKFPPLLPTAEVSIDKKSA
jgi:hypothetical protein